MGFSFKTLAASAAFSLAAVGAQASIIDFDILVTSSIDAATLTPGMEYLGDVGTGSYDSDSMGAPIGDELTLTIFGQTFNADDDFLAAPSVTFDPTDGITDILFGVVDDDLFTMMIEDNITAPNIVDFSVINVLPSMGTQLAQVQIEVQTAAPIPLPASVLLMMGGLGMLGAAGRRKARQTA